MARPRSALRAPRPPRRPRRSPPPRPLAAATSGQHPGNIRVGARVLDDGSPDDAFLAEPPP